MTAAACVLIVAAIETPDQETVLLTVAILGALPWSLALLLMDPSPGFAERAGLVVALGLFLNVAAVWWVTAAVKLRVSSAKSWKADSH